MTIQDVLNDCGYTFRMIAVWIDGTPYRREHFATAVVPDGSEVQALHMISGG
jgi:sulfur carrier protein ThiS